ncbi:MAG: dihydropteroate synthase [Proteobacteria bacterium]|nr:dihydropteroate synthase [Pseudomonadota bacterium]MBU1709699.1 dihydropteroate synthase [Pseudomonadota bacterium]
MTAAGESFASSQDTRVQIIGILNVTPDSFSDGGIFFNEDQAVKQALAMVSAGADIIDVGGESTRPFAAPVLIDEELRRVIPVIKAIRKHSPIPISIDTTKAEVARVALAAGANIINDISALRFDPEMAPLAHDADCPLIIMHMQGTPETMQVNPRYNDVISESIAFLGKRLEWAENHGIKREKIIVDPGIGFGKTVSHNLTILKHIADLKALGCSILIGHSRKSFIGKILGDDLHDRDTATAAISMFCAMQGVAYLRVHDVKKTVQAVRIAEAILAAP